MESVPSAGCACCLVLARAGLLSSHVLPEDSKAEEWPQVPEGGQACARCWLDGWPPLAGISGGGAVVLPGAGPWLLEASPVPGLESSAVLRRHPSPTQGRVSTCPPSTQCTKGCVRVRFSLIEVKITNDETNHFKVHSSVRLEPSQCCATTRSF